MQDKPKLLLAYWNCRGRAQAIRFLLEYLGVPYEEKRYEIKNAMDWFGKEKHEIQHSFPNLPYLKDGDKYITETEAIYQYICRKNDRRDLLGKTEDDQIEVCTMRWVLHDLVYFIGETAYDKDFEKIKDTQLEKRAAPKLQQLSKYLGTKEYLQGYITYVDFLFFEILTIVQAMKPELLDKHENLKQYLERFSNQQFMKDYVTSDRYIKRPFYGVATWNPMD